jgi:hypothetical protein
VAVISFLSKPPKERKNKIRIDDKIKFIKLDSYFSFMRVAKSANSDLFKDFCNEAEMEKNIQIGGIYFVIVPKGIKDWGVLQK